MLAHHERWDGGGYPRRLAGEAIPHGARLIAVADTYDVITARDSYRKPISTEAAIDELQRVSGHQLDPEVVHVFIGCSPRATCRSRTAMMRISRQN